MTAVPLLPRHPVLIFATFLVTGNLADQIGCRAAAPAGYPVQPVEVIRDTFGVPHIYATTLADAVFGQAVCQAEDNLPQVLENLAASRGQSARRAGRSRLEADLIVHAFNLPGLARHRHRTHPGHRVGQDQQRRRPRRCLSHPCRQAPGCGASQFPDIA